MKRKCAYVVLTLLLVLGLCVLVPTPAAFGDVTRILGVSDPNPEYIATPTSQPTIPVQPLTAEEVNHASSIMQADASVQNLLGMHPYEISLSSPRYSGTTGELVGAGIRIHLHQPTTLTGPWATGATRQAQGEEIPYRLATYHLSVTRVTDLLISVDFRTDSVISVTPLNTGASASIAPATRRKMKADARTAARHLPNSVNPNVIPGDGGGNCGQYLAADNDWFYNWDFGTETIPPDCANSDWPVTVIFKNNANIVNVKTDIGWDLAGNPQHERLFDGTTPPGVVWDTDSGKKDGCLFVGADTHYRVYADTDDKMYNTTWHYYVIATTHHDVDECSYFWRSFGWSEDAIGDLGNRIRDCCVNSTLRWTVTPDARNLYNPIPTEYEIDMSDGTHHFQNDGLADIVYVDH